ncbi:hypothetical protein D1007_41596 [Hordeum vulgare]|nr:hypothetical protein D1007_41596 [Hordeum vulgare]
MTHIKTISNGAAIEFGMPLVETHMRKMELTVVYTNDPVMVENSINTMERLLAKDDIRFATMDTNDPKVLKTSGLPCYKLVDIHDHYMIQGSKKDMESLVGLVKAIIDAYYGAMKAECGKKKPAWHSAWVKRLDEHHIHTAAKGSYTC